MSAFVMPKLCVMLIDLRFRGMWRFPYGAWARAAAAATGWWAESGASKS